MLFYKHWSITIFLTFSSNFDSDGKLRILDVRTYVHSWNILLEWNYPKYYEMNKLSYGGHFIFMNWKLNWRKY